VSAGAPGAGGADRAAPAGAGLTRASVPTRDGEPTTLVLSRHGRTADNERGVFAGRDGHDLPLSPAGEADAARLAAALQRLGTPASPVPAVGPVSALVASPMLRTRGTAKVAAERLGLDVTIDDGWAEMAFGAWDGLTYAEISGRDPEAVAAWWGDLAVAPPGGESFDALAERVATARRRTVDAHPGGVVAVVAHGGPLRVVVRDALDGGPAMVWRLRITPCALTVVRYWPDGGVEVVTVNAAPGDG
jgi:broad specificity phosphatase PhoE